MLGLRFQIGIYLEDIVRVKGALKSKSKQCIADTFSIDRFLAIPI